MVAAAMEAVVMEAGIRAGTAAGGAAVVATAVAGEEVAATAAAGTPGRAVEVRTTIRINMIEGLGG